MSSPFVRGPMTLDDLRGRVATDMGAGETEIVTTTTIIEDEDYDDSWEESSEY